MIISFQYPAGPYERWTEEAAKGLIGILFPAKIEDKEIGEGKVLDAKITDEGRMLDLTLDWPDDPESRRLLEKNMGNDFSIK